MTFLEEYLPPMYFAESKNSTYQVVDPESGWCSIRPYDSDVWKYLRASFWCPYLLLSGTMEEKSFTRILSKLFYTSTEIINCGLIPKHVSEPLNIN